MHRSTILFWFLGCLTLTSCTSELSFTTIEHETSARMAGRYREPEANIVIVASEAEIDILGEWVNPEAKQQLEQLNYKRSFAILVLHGWRGRCTDRYHITIQEIQRENNTVKVQAEFEAPEPNTGCNLGATSPYHLVTVSKRGKWDQVVTFLLMDGETIVAETEHYIP